MTNEEAIKILSIGTSSKLSSPKFEKLIDKAIEVLLSKDVPRETHPDILRLDFLDDQPHGLLNIVPGKPVRESIDEWIESCKQMLIPDD